MEIKQTELVQGRERVNGSAEVEGRDGESSDAAARVSGGGAADAPPGGGAGIRACPVGEEVAVGVGLEAEESESIGVVGW